MAEDKYKDESPPAPNPARVYERADPCDESGMCDLEGEKVNPSDREDEMPKAVKNRHEPGRQINADEEKRKIR